MSDILYIVVPCYNEEEVLMETSKRLGIKIGELVKMEKISPDSRIVFVDDGSKDKTWEIIETLHNQDPVFSGVKLAGNKGHQNALLAGLMTAKDKADMIISMDADLQDDIDAVDEFVARYYEGCDIVYGVRGERTTDTAFKRGTAQGFYRVMEMLGVKIVYNHADYRLMSRRAVEGLSEFQEVNLFLRGIVPLIGYKTATVEYARGERFAGESKYPLKKMLSFAMEGVTSFSVKPIGMVTGVGVFLLATGCIFGLYSLIACFADWWRHADWVIITLVWAIGGLQLTALGIIGEYVGKIYKEVKARPRYIIETVLNTASGGKPFGKKV